MPLTKNVEIRKSEVGIDLLQEGDDEMMVVADDEILRSAQIFKDEKTKETAVMMGMHLRRMIK